MRQNKQMLQLPSGIVDERTARALVTGPGGVLEEIDLRTGEVVARAGEGGRPLAVDRDVAVAWRYDDADGPAARIFGMVASGGALRTVWEHRLELPEWADVNSDEADRFGMDAQPVAEHLVAVRWFARSRYEGGAPPSAEAEDAATNDAGGVVVLDARTGLPESATAEVERSSSASAIPPLIGGDERAMSYRSGDGRDVHAWRFDAGQAQMLQVPGQPDIWLARSSGGAVNRSVLTSEPGADVAVTVDGEIILVHETSTEPGMWRAVHTATNADAGTFDLGAGLLGAVAVDDTLVAEVAETTDGTDRRLLVGNGLTNGERLWSHVLHESVQRSAPPLPP